MHTCVPLNLERSPTRSPVRKKCRKWTCECNACKSTDPLICKAVESCEYQNTTAKMFWVKFIQTVLPQYDVEGTGAPAKNRTEVMSLDHVFKPCGCSSSLHILIIIRWYVRTSSFISHQSECERSTEIQLLTCDNCVAIISLCLSPYFVAIEFPGT